MIHFLIYAYFCAGILSSLLSYLAQKLLGPSKLFSHGKAADSVSVSVEDRRRSWIELVEGLTVSKHLFWHFYASGFILSVFYIVMIIDNSSISASLMAVQCLRRLFECFLVMPGGRDSQMHLIHYLIGLSYYPVLLISFSLQSEARANLTWTLALSLFIVASGLQSYCHWILGHERSKQSKTQKASKSKSHRPLNHPLFKMIHAPHYFAELLIYTAIAGLNGFHPLSLLNLIWIITILGVSAKNSADWLSKRWGHKSHEEFCKYLLIPFLF